MAERETVYISQLPEIETLTDETAFVTDDGTDNNKITADNLAAYLNGKINIDDKLAVVKTEMETYTDNALDEAKSYAGDIGASAVTQAKQYTNSTVANPNLLINGDFQIWQRGNEITQSASTSKYTADGWIVGFVNDGKTHTVKKNDDGSLYINPNGGYTKLRQVIEIPESLRGETVCLQVCVKSGKADSSSAVLQIGSGTYTEGTWSTPSITPVTATSEYSIFTKNFTVPETGYLFVEIYDYAANILNIKWVKLEVGSVGTAFIPRNYGEELALCQRYFYRLNLIGANSLPSLGNGMLRTTTVCHTTIYLPVALRTLNPTVTATGTWQALIDGGNINISAIARHSCSGTEIVLMHTLSTASTIGKNVYVQGLNGTNADLTLDCSFY